MTVVSGTGSSLWRVHSNPGLTIKATSLRASLCRKMNHQCCAMPQPLPLCVCFRRAAAAVINYSCCASPQPMLLLSVCFGGSAAAMGSRWKGRGRLRRPCVPRCICAPGASCGCCDPAYALKVQCLLSTLPYTFSCGGFGTSSVYAPASVYTTSRVPSLHARVQRILDSPPHLVVFMVIFVFLVPLAGLYVSRNTYIRCGIVEWAVKNPVHMVSQLDTAHYAGSGQLIVTSL